MLVSSCFASRMRSKAELASSQTLRTRSPMAWQLADASLAWLRPCSALCASARTLRQVASASSSDTDCARRTCAARCSVSALSPSSAAAAAPPWARPSSSAWTTKSSTEGPLASLPASSSGATPRSSSSFSRASGRTTPCAAPRAVPRLSRLPMARLVLSSWARRLDERRHSQPLETRSPAGRRSARSAAGPTSRAPHASLAAQWKPTNQRYRSGRSSCCGTSSSADAS
mmetsp:Transcript_55138/g.164135  ORF Transcript_55138/g.164135 Transcript_55138/m.164135 type:complete len:229 (+) Transcript_55138:250-936(+)